MIFVFISRLSFSRSGLKKIILFSLAILHLSSAAQVRIRVFADQKPSSAIVTIVTNSYEIHAYPGVSCTLKAGESFLVAKYGPRMAFKMLNNPGIVVDSILVKGLTDDCSFLVKLNGTQLAGRTYKGDLKISGDMGTLFFVNLCDEEKYIAGVVHAEGGTGRNIEYFKTQAVIARTYMYKYMDKHMHDGYNLCDNTHCQAYNGYSDDPVLNRAVHETRGEVILGKDSVLIISAFHSNCGGETSPAEDVWLTGQPYLRKVSDPYCTTSRNATWETRIPAADWIRVLSNSGYNGTGEISSFRFSQNTRSADYRIQSFTIPLRTLRNELGLRSTFFSVIPDGNTLVLKGRGYGHGVGLCQEGAMVMAERGFSYSDIVKFYYPGVILTAIANARKIHSVYSPNDTITLY